MPTDNCEPSRRERSPDACVLTESEREALQWCCDLVRWTLPQDRAVATEETLRRLLERLA